MDRREFLRAIGLAPAALLTAKAVAADNMIKPIFVKPKNPPIDLFEFQRRVHEELYGKDFFKHCHGDIARLVSYEKGRIRVQNLTLRDIYKV